MRERFVYDPDEKLIWDTIAKRKYYMSEMLCDILNRCWNQTKRFEEYSNNSKKHLDCLEQAIEHVFEKPEPSIDDIIKVYNELKVDNIKAYY